MDMVWIFNYTYYSYYFGDIQMSTITHEKNCESLKGGECTCGFYWEICDETNVWNEQEKELADLRNNYKQQLESVRILLSLVAKSRSAIEELLEFVGVINGADDTDPFLRKKSLELLEKWEIHKTNLL